ncbi:MAG: nuclear transport factor 2 family protein [Pirellulaceae bacterium]|jgi:beta-aspartyl-peptidase (threonine type)|nr:nuclear transport factor 2 family protein [Pirellulaceae bacterium]
MNQRPHTCFWQGTTILLACQFLSIVNGSPLSADDEPVDVEKLSRVLTNVLAVQSSAWNDADIEGFMEHYWKSEQLTFSSGDKTTRGWQATIARYKKRYTTPEKMGHLTFDHLEFVALSDSTALVLGQWHLKRDTENIGGNFSLVFRRIDARWLIIHDHTSSLDTEDP